MTSETISFDTQHEDMIHDAQLNYYGKRLATCSSDGTIRIFEIEGQEQKLQHTLKDHEGPVWQVAWAHPKFGNILASCSYDGHVLIFKESESGWSVIKNHDKHSSSAEGTWESQMINDAHPSGVNTVSWAPIAAISAIPGFSPNSLVKQIASGGCDNLVKVWTFKPETNDYELTHTLSGHTEWVRDVAFAPNVGLGCIYLASCSQDRTVLLWYQEINPNDSSVSTTWVQKPLSLQPFADVVWRVSWSLSGNILAVSCGNNQITLWKENMNGDWENITQLDEKGITNSLESSQKEAQ
ncbi:Protein transport protein SEC13-1 [Smittium culicis]|uniref:Protein transport protein SEC13-1 n=1 Tax=Smittium culicis TaxID=133412 RepID=A0A1R1X5Z7_9FUNG|nr:Protein transport protein SEC13-1 [Smittium culicis]